MNKSTVLLCVVAAAVWFGTVDVCDGQAWLVRAQSKEEAKLKIRGLRAALVS